MQKNRVPRAARPHSLGPLHSIARPAALRSLVTDLIRIGYGGNVLEAVRGTGIARAIWMRWRQRSAPPPREGVSPRQSMRHAIAEQLESVVIEHLGDKGHQRFLAAMAPPGAYHVMGSLTSGGPSGGTIAFSTGGPRPGSPRRDGLTSCSRQRSLPTGDSPIGCRRTASTSTGSALPSCGLWSPTWRGRLAGESRRAMRNRSGLRLRKLSILSLEDRPIERALPSP